MDFKHAIIENAWGGFSIDYGLLHLQLATPVTVLIFILVMIVALNRLLFQPVLRTLDLRNEKITGSLKHSERLSTELERLEQDFEQSLQEAKKNVMHIHDSERTEGYHEREEMIGKERNELELEITKQTELLHKDLNETQKRFEQLNKELSSQVSERLLN